MSHQVRQALPKEQREKIDGIYMLAWIFASYLAIAGFRLGMMMHLALPWIALAFVVRHPHNFTLLSYDASPLMALIWFIVGPFHLVSPAFANFLGPQQRFVVLGLFLGGFFATLTIVLSPPPAAKHNRFIRFAPLLLISMIYGYVGVKEVDTLFDRSAGMVYRSKVLERKPHGAIASPDQLVIEPWGSDKMTERVTIPVFGHYFKPGELICISLRPGALGVSWYSPEQCSSK